MKSGHLDINYYFNMQPNSSDRYFSSKCAANGFPLYELFQVSAARRQAKKKDFTLTRHIKCFFFARKRSRSVFRKLKCAHWNFSVWFVRCSTCNWREICWWKVAKALSERSDSERETTRENRRYLLDFLGVVLKKLDLDILWISLTQVVRHNEKALDQRICDLTRFSVFYFTIFTPL